LKISLGAIDNGGNCGKIGAWKGSYRVADETRVVSVGWGNSKPSCNSVTSDLYLNNL